MGMLGSRKHTAGDITRWTVDYSRWLENTATILTADVRSSSETCTAEDSSVLGRMVIFFMNGGEQGETLVVTITISDSLQNVKTDTLSFTVVAP